VLIALDQVNVGGDIIRQSFLILLAGVVLALALAFGLGGRDWAARCSSAGGRARARRSAALEMRARPPIRESGAAPRIRWAPRGTARA
jgi:hypothetical protein